MAIENVAALLQASQKNPELMAKIEAVTSSEQVVEIGAGEGLEFTTEEAETFRQKLIAMAQKAEDGELSEDELEDVSGGGMLFEYGLAVTLDATGAYKSNNKLVQGGSSIVKKVFSGW